MDWWRYGLLWRLMSGKTKSKDLTKREPGNYWYIFNSLGWLLCSYYIITVRVYLLWTWISYFALSASFNLFSCFILATKRNMGRGWKFSLLLLIVWMLCQCKYSLTQLCKHWTQEAVLSSFFYLVSHRNRGMSSLIYRWSAFYMNTMLWEGSIRRKTHSRCWLDNYSVVYCLCSKTQRKDDLVHC